MIKKILFILFISSIILFSINSCTKEDDESTPTTSTQITGEWKCNDNESENGIYGTQSFIVDISKEDTIYCVTNFGNLGIQTDVYAEITGSNFIINEQTIDDIIIHGTGNFSNNNKTINITYFLDNEKIISIWGKK